MECLLSLPVHHGEDRKRDRTEPFQPTSATLELEEQEQRVEERAVGPMSGPAVAGQEEKGTPGRQPRPRCHPRRRWADAPVLGTQHFSRPRNKPPLAVAAVTELCLVCAASRAEQRVSRLAPRRSGAPPNRTEPKRTERYVYVTFTFTLRYVTLRYTLRYVTLRYVTCRETEIGPQGGRTNGRSLPGVPQSSSPPGMAAVRVPIPELLRIGPLYGEGRAWPPGLGGP